MSGRGAGGESRPEELAVQVAGGDGEPERLLMLSRAERGRVHVREWTGDSWNRSADEREEEADAVYATLERAVRRGRRVSEELYRIRAWLSGAAL
jgi:hypothetical protein